MQSSQGAIPMQLSERCSSAQTYWQLIWFLTPTVTLCEQQYETFKKNLPGNGIRMLSGNDNVERWTKQSDWDAILANVRIVLSTHQVLLDALTHAFVSMSRLALLIFDEAHHASQNHPANRIMSNFFLLHIKDEDANLPRILGLSASPLISPIARQVEQNLHAEVRVPKVHRSELMRHVHMPEFIQIHYENGPVNGGTSSPLLAALECALPEYDILQDPYCINLIRQHHEGRDVREALAKVLRSRKTYCSEQLKTLCSKAKAMAEELGLSPMNCSPMLLDGLSQKVEKLLHTLVEEMHGDAEFTGLVFVEQRVWVAALAEIISIHSKTKDLFRVGTFVGTSQFSKRKANIATLPEPRNQQSTLDDFRSGSLNLILATSVLEEGIDISSCHLVICFERPKNLKSFVQRRGRARREKSKYLIFRDNLGTGKSHKDWQSLENEMRAAYVDELRQVELAEELELQREDGERVFRVPGTGALLTLDNACQHLYHFCAILASGPYLDARPQFSFNEDPPGNTIAHVVLPISVDPVVRTAKSTASWRTERMARKDAAFVAYKALHHAGLVNNNLLPARDEPENDAEELQKSKNQPSLVPIRPSFDPWQLNAIPSQSDYQIYRRVLIHLTTPDQEPMNMLLHTPVSCPEIPSFILHWNKVKKYEVHISQIAPSALAPENIQIMREITHVIFYSVYHSRMQESSLDFHWLLLPCNVQDEIEDFSSLSQWKQSVTGSRLASDRLHENHCDISTWGLVEVQGERRRYIPHALVIHSDSDGGVPLHCLKAIRMPRRRNFLYAIDNEQNCNDAHTRIEDLNAEDCVVQNLPASYTIFALLFPSILHKLSTHMLADRLRMTMLNPVQIDDSHINTLVTAITSSAADEKDNYQRLEFLGDCILKFVTSVHLMASNLTWPESYLTGKKSRIVSNGSLTRAALEAGLERFIIFDRFTGARWSPRYGGDVCESPECAEQSWRSSKVVADVVESLIGASYIVGGLSKAALCIQTLLPRVPSRGLLSELLPLALGVQQY
ncbi:hypothetical protein DM02DRAFT_701523 [Periconia macrospinosa]|uniref:Dicer-like protein 2 n=1 Tax=Periconia macrospinosa TaxID=97972 RepID=A0A2V1D230_9PLEO|nr:hypothetical protein DM02DRAFT_701523 [Periconia macrospinosa]